MSFSAGARHLRHSILRLLGRWSNLNIAAWGLMHGAVRHVPRRAGAELTCVADLARVATPARLCTASPGSAPAGAHRVVARALLSP